MKTIAFPVLQRLLVLLFVGVCLGNLQGAEAPKELTLFKGATTRIPVPDGVAKVVIGNEKVLDARPDKDGLSVLATGISEGASELRVVRTQGEESLFHFVVRTDLQETVKTIQSLLADVEGVEVAALNDKIILKGTILTLSDEKKVQQVVEAYAGSVINFAKLDQRRIYGFIEKEIQKDLIESGLDTVKASIVRDQVRLTGVVINLEESERAMKIAQLRLPNPVNMMRVEDVMIETDVEFIQVNTDAADSYGNNILKSLGSSSTGSFGGGGNGKPSLSFGVSATAAAKINWLIGNGNATNLLRTHLSTKNGEEGRFQSGGQDNISVSGATGGDVKTVDYGIIIRVKPVLRTRDLVENQVSVEVSIPVQRNQGLLVLDRFSSSGTVVCKKGDSVLLSGLLQSLGSRSSQKTPLLGYIPLLDHFFSEKDKKKGRKELVAVITPRPNLPTPNSSAPNSEQGRRLAEDFRGQK